MLQYKRNLIADKYELNEAACKSMLQAMQEQFQFSQSSDGIVM